MSEIPLYDVPKIIGDEVLDNIQEVLASGWLTLGPKTEQFENEFASLQGTDGGVAVNSCTSALYASLQALGIGPGDTVVVPAITFAATANVVRLLGADVVICDVTDTGNLDPESLRRVVTDNDDVEAVIPVHLYGLPVDMPEVVDIAADHDLRVIEDCAHAPAATIDGKPVGSFGDAGCFSFYATKNLTTGEGGMVVTSDPVLEEQVRKFRNHHQSKSPDEKKNKWGYDVDGLGFNFRMSEFQAAIGLSQLEKIDEMTESRQAVARRYREGIEDIPGLSWYGADERKDHVYHLFVVHVEDEYPLSRDELYDYLSAHDIVTGVHYPPIPHLSYYDGIAGEYEHAGQLFDRILSLPMFPHMEESTQQQVIDTLRGAKA